jgi:hypothetical protein
LLVSLLATSPWWSRLSERPLGTQPANPFIDWVPDSSGMWLAFIQIGIVYSADGRVGGDSAQGLAQWSLLITELLCACI